MTSTSELKTTGAERAPAPVVFFLSNSTGITAETLGNTLLTQFPGHRFERRTIPFITTTEEARRVVGTIDSLAAAGRRPIVFSTAVTRDIRAILSQSKGHFVDLYDAHIAQLESALQATASGEPGKAHGVGDAIRYQSRMTAVEYAMEHDDGQSIRALGRAALILIAPSRCGKTPTAMYLALQHGILAANFPLIEEDFSRQSLPDPLLPYIHKCFGLTSLPVRLSQIRQERRPDTTYASLAQCSYELRNAEEMYRSNGVPSMNSASMSVEEISATILQRMQLSH